MPGRTASAENCWHMSIEVLKMIKYEEIGKVAIPPGVTVTEDNGIFEVSGKLGKVSRTFRNNYIKLETSNDVVNVLVSKHNKKVLAVAETWSSTLRTLCKGVTEGFKYELKIDYTHFPMRVSVKGTYVMIENFLGGRSARSAKIVGDTKVTVKGDRVHLEGIDRKDLGETAANIERATKIRHFDLRIFQDGVYLVDGN